MSAVLHQPPSLLTQIPKENPQGDSAALEGRTCLFAVLSLSRYLHLDPALQPVCAQSSCSRGELTRGLVGLGHWREWKILLKPA